MNFELFQDDQHHRVDVPYEPFMTTISAGAPVGAAIGSIRPVFTRMDAELGKHLPLEQYLQMIESDWLNFAPCVSVFHSKDWRLDVERHKQQLDRQLECLSRGEPVEVEADDEDDPSIFSKSGKYFAALHFVLIDSIGDEVPLEVLQRLQPSWQLEYQPGVYEAGLLLKEPITDFGKARALVDAMEEAGLCVREGDGPWVFAHRPPRNPASGHLFQLDEAAFRCRFVAWRPERRFAIEELVRGLDLELPDIAK